MASLFPPGSGTVLRCVLALGAATLVGIPTALCLYVRTPYATHAGFEVVQPVMFDHRHHVADDGIDCRYCHADADRSPYAGVPPVATCMGCHGQIWNGSPLLEPVRRAWFTGQAFAWERVHQLPDFVYFDHSVHVTRGIGCVSCHGRVDEMAQLHQVQPLTMGWCLGCHRHPEPNLRPPEEIASMTWTPPPDHEAYGRELARRYQTRHLTSCSTCHR